MSLAVDTKKCSKCKHEKMVQDFSEDRTRPDGRASYCKRCYALQVRGQRAKMHGVKLEQVELLLEAQGGLCACCGVTPVSLEPGSKHVRGSMSFVDYRTGWGFPAGVLCHLCMPHVNTVKNNRAAVGYLTDTMIGAAS